MMCDERFGITDWLLFGLLCAGVFVALLFLVLLMLPEFSFMLWTKFR